MLEGLPRVAIAGAAGVEHSEPFQSRTIHRTSHTELVNPRNLALFNAVIQNSGHFCKNILLIRRECGSAY